MGYSHYWRPQRDFTQQEWNDIVAVATEVCAQAEKQTIALARWDGEEGTYREINSDEINLNGYGDESCESFNLTRVKGDSFQFCKTRELPYDAVVVSILFAAKTIAPGALEVSSDGGDEAIAMQFPVEVPAVKRVKAKLLPKAVVKPKSTAQGYTKIQVSVWVPTDNADNAVETCANFATEFERVYNDR